MTLASAMRVDPALTLVPPAMTDRRTGCRITFAVILLAVLAFSLLTFAHQQQWEIYLASGVVGMGMGFAMAAMANVIVQSVPTSQTSIAAGMNANIRTIGGSIGAAVTASLVVSHVGVDHLPDATGYTDGYLFLLVGAVIATVASLAIPTAPSSRR
ncbi:MAG: major facilitator superfamily 1 [Acidimicrobiaceae bacterium]|jgi:MFS family permease|nr:major facilitator superfamily 1 [Acidimicrobiaceae bacterium]